MSLQDLKSLMELGTSALNVIVLLWLITRTYKVAMPRLADTFKEEIAEARKEHREDRATWRDELREQRREFLVALEKRDVFQERARLEPKP